MKYEDEKFIVYYNKCDEAYIDRLLDIIRTRMPQILSFFHIEYDEKITIKLYDNIDEYRNNLEKSFAKEAEAESIKQEKRIQPRKYQEWMIANTEDGNINMQSLELVRSKEDYKDYTQEEFLYNACHEYTHLCQQKVGSKNPGWFWEVLATVLGNPECQPETEEPFTIKDLEENFDKIDGYGAVFKIGKYLFDNYDRNFILSLVHDNDKMYETVNEIITKINSPQGKIEKH